MATVDLPPGSRSRMWALFTLTSIVGIGTYWTFGRIEILLLAAAVLAILIYLLLGVSLTLRRDRALLDPILEAVVEASPEPLWVILDPHGVVLYLSQKGSEGLSHSQVLVGQRLEDLLRPGDRPSRIAYREMLRYGAVGRAWEGTLQLIGEHGAQLSPTLKTSPILHIQAKRWGLIGLSENKK